MQHESHVTCTALLGCTVGIKDEQSSAAENTADPLPDIKDMLKKKERERELEKMEEEMKVDVKKIKRSDKVAFAKVGHLIPFVWAPFLLFSLRVPYSYWSRILTPTWTTLSLSKKSMELSVHSWANVPSLSWAFHPVLCK